MLLLIDSREQPPTPAPHDPRRPSLRALWPIPATLFLLGVAAMVPPLPSYLLILAAVVLVARALTRAIPSSNGLEDYRQ
jgi:hypothetical protein